MQIFCVSLQGKTLTLDVKGDYKISKLRQIVVERIGTHDDELRLVWGGKEIQVGTEGDLTLDKLGIQNGSTVFALLRLRGGSSDHISVTISGAGYSLLRSDKVGSVQSQLAKQFDVNAVRLLRGGKVMDPAKTIGSYDLKSGDDLTMLTKWLTSSDGVRMTTAEPDPIDGTDDEGNPRAVMSCGHAFTPETLTQTARSYISENLRTEIKCPLSTQGSGSLQCKSGTIWPYSDFTKAAKLDEKELKFFDEKINKNYITKSLNIQQCPKCETYVFRDDMKLIRVSCPGCRLAKKQTYEFCFFCLREWKGSSAQCGYDDCNRVKILNKFLGDCETITVSGVATKGIPALRACPIETHPKDNPIVWGHLAGCKHQKCPTCSGEFCWICLKPKKDGSW